MIQNNIYNNIKTHSAAWNKHLNTENTHPKTPGTLQTKEHINYSLDVPLHLWHFFVFHSLPKMACSVPKGWAAQGQDGWHKPTPHTSDTLCGWLIMWYEDQWCSVLSTHPDIQKISTSLLLSQYNSGFRTSDSFIFRTCIRPTLLYILPVELELIYFSAVNSAAAAPASCRLWAWLDPFRVNMMQMSTQSLSTSPQETETSGKSCAVPNEVRHVAVWRI